MSGVKWINTGKQIRNVGVAMKLLQRNYYWKVYNLYIVTRIIIMEKDDPSSTSVV